MKEFKDEYVLRGQRILDVGAGTDDIKVNEKDIIINNFSKIFYDCKYERLDFDNADIVIKGYDWPIEDETYDIVITNSCLEHDKFFWMTLNNMARVLKTGGYMCIIVPSRGKIHRQNSIVDCYRFLPDSLLIFGEIMGIELLKVTHEDDYWGDLRGIYKK